MPGSVIRQRHISREQVRANPGTLYVFGDNMERRGYGGQAAAMRGEPNAVGVPTKWRPERSPNAYFSDDVMSNPGVLSVIRDAFDQIRSALAAGRDVVIPTDGLGTGLADLPNRAARLHARIERSIATLERVEMPTVSRGMRM